MTASSQWKIIASDLEVIRDLAKQVLEISHDPVNEERRELWYEHNSLQPTRPLVLAEAAMRKRTVSMR